MKRTMLLILTLIVALLCSSSVLAGPGAVGPSANRDTGSTSGIAGKREELQEVPAAAATASSGIDLLVLNQSGEPASSAFVIARRPGVFTPIVARWTDSSGQLHLDVADGDYDLGVASTVDHFVVLQDGVRAPVAVTMTCASTVRVQVLVKGLDGLASAGAQVSFEPNIFLGQVGETAADGRLDVDLSAGMYSALAVSSPGRFYHNLLDVNCTGPSEVTFDASQMSKGYVAVQLQGLPDVGVGPMFLSPQVRLWMPTLTLADGQSAALSVGRYAFQLLVQLRDSADASWEFRMGTTTGAHNIEAGTVMTLPVSASYTTTLTAELSACSPGTRIKLVARVADEFGNYASYIYRDGRNVYAHIVVRASNGDVVLEADRLDTIWSGATLALPSGAGPGLYTIDWQLDTGPLAGLLQAHAELPVPCRQIYLPLVLRLSS